MKSSWYLFLTDFPCDRHSVCIYQTRIFALPWSTSWS